MTDNEQDKQDNTQPDVEDVTAETADAEVMASEEEGGFKWVEPPAFEVEHKDDCVCEVKVTIPVANVKAMLHEVYSEVNDGVQVPGFRRGKAPRKLLEKRLGKYARSTVVERLADQASRKLMKEHELMPVSEVDITGLEDPENLPEDQDMVYTLTFETPGKCELGDYKNIEITKPEFDIPDKDVDESLEHMRMRFGRYEPLEDGVAEDGDQVVTTFTGLVDGEPFEGNSAENYPYILGSHRFGEEMEAAMLGAKSGQTVTAELTFPEDYRDASVANKTARYEITINEIKRRVLPELDEEFAKKLGFETVPEMREGVRKQIRDNADEQIKVFLNRQAQAKLVECSTFTLPKSQIQSFVDSEYESMENRLVEEHVPVEEIEEQRPAMKEEAEKQGLFAVKSMYAIRALAEIEGIKVEEEDLEAYARSLSQGNEQHYELMKQYVASDEVRSISEYRILETKTLDKLVEQAKIVTESLPDDDDENGEAAPEAADDKGDAND